MRICTSKTICVIVLLVLSILLTSSIVFAQNPAQLIPITDEDDKELSDSDIDDILSEEGIYYEEQADLSGFSGEYTLGVNDIIEVTVLRHPEVSGQYIINNEGNIQYEFVGDIRISGLTKDKASEILAAKLNKFIISPEVIVKIIGYNSKVVYVIGEVSSPGKIFMRGDTITVREALIQAGLPMLSAKSSKSALITPSADGKPIRKKINVHKLLYEGDLRENLVMKPGDTLYIPPTVMAKAMRVIQPITAPISTAAGTGRTVMTGF